MRYYNKYLFLLPVVFILLTSLTYGQSSSNTATRVRNGTADPATCTTTGSNIFYRTDTGTLKVCTAANTWTAAGSSTPGGSNTQLQYNNSSSFGGVSGVTSDGTNITAGSGNLRATSPRITTSILDANGNSMLAFTPTTSAVDGFTFTNAATASPATVSMAGTGSDTNINLSLSPKGSTGRVLITSTTGDAMLYAANGKPLQIGTISADALHIKTGDTSRWGVHGTTGDIYQSAGNDGAATLRNVDSSSTNPTFSFGNDTDTGIGRAAANQLSLITGGVEAARFTSTTTTLTGSLKFTALADSGTAPTLSAGFGTSPSVSANNGTVAFTITIGTGGTDSTGTITLPAAATGWVCSLYNITNEDSSVTHQTGGSTTTVTVKNYARTTGLAAAWAAADVLACMCRAY